MTVLRPRSRSISVRLSEEEFATLQRLCIATGARSVSDLARKAMRDILERTPTVESASEYAVQICDLEQKMEELASKLARFRATQSDIGE